MTVEPPIPARVRRLREQGYSLLRDALLATTLAMIDAELAPPFAQTPLGQHDGDGATTERFGRLLVRSSHAQALALHPLVHRIVQALLLRWCERTQINTVQAIAVYPGAPQQRRRRAQDIWPGLKGQVEYLVSVLRPLTRFTHLNGAIQVWSGTHMDAALKEQVSASPETIKMNPGAALLWLGSTLQGAGANHGAAVRRSVVVSYALDWIKPYENPWQANPPEIARTFAPELAALVGYREHRSKLGNSNGAWPSVPLGKSAGPDWLPHSIEALGHGPAAVATAQLSSGFLAL